jgi:hypothetical protein
MLSAEPVCSCAFFFVHFAHETAGAARTRSSLRPLLGGRIVNSSGANARRGRGVVFMYRHCERSEAIHLAAQRKNGLLRFARNDELFEN